MTTAPPCRAGEKHGRKPKQRFATRDLAWIEVARIILRARRNTGRDAQRPWKEPYRCPGCGWWHLTTARGPRKVLAREQVARIHEGLRPWA